MRQKEREDICRLIAEWEFGEGSTSEAIGMSRCADELRTVFDLTDTEDLQNSRFVKVISVMQTRGFPDDDDEEYVAWEDALEELWEEVGYDGVVDLIEEGSLIERLRPAADHLHGIILAQAGASI